MLYTGSCGCLSITGDWRAETVTHLDLEEELSFGSCVVNCFIPRIDTEFVFYGLGFALVDAFLGWLC